MAIALPNEAAVILFDSHPRFTHDRLVARALGHDEFTEFFRRIADDHAALAGDHRADARRRRGPPGLVADLLQKHSPETVRFLLLGTHYRSPIEYSEDRLNEVKRSLDGFHRFFERYQRITGATFHQLEAPGKRGAFEGSGDFLAEVARHRETFLNCMDDDFNTGGAVGAVYELLTTLNRFADAQQLEGSGKANAAMVSDFRRGAVALRELCNILGLFWEAPKKETGGNDQLVNGLMQLLLDLRADARKTKNFAVADQIRKRLTEIGVTLEDRPGGTGWRVG